MLSLQFYSYRDRNNHKEESIPFFGIDSWAHKKNFNSVLVFHTQFYARAHMYIKEEEEE